VTGCKAQNVVFPLGFGSSGLQIISIRRADSKRASGTEFRKIEVGGAGIEGARLIRARWGPAAVHARYESSQCEASKLWVFETQSVRSISSYFPITTSFGYFGASFNAEGLAAGGFNFSMWVANGKATNMPAVSAMPLFLAHSKPRRGI